MKFYSSNDLRDMIRCRDRWQLWSLYFHAENVTADESINGYLEILRLELEWHEKGKD